MNEANFSRRSVVVFSVVSALSLATALGLTVFGEKLGPPSAGTDGFSPSAVGHLAFVRFLERLDIPVVRSRHATARRSPASSLLVVAEPNLSGEEPSRVRLFREMLARRGPVLVVCPKWSGEEDPMHAGWVEDAALNPSRVPDAVLEIVSKGLQVTRPKEITPTRSHQELEGEPTLPASPQLLSDHDDLEPVLRTHEGILVGRVEREDGAIVHVLSDPDLLSGQGLARGENALLVARLVESLRPPGGTVVLDETLHGLESSPNVWLEMLSWPLVLPVGLSLLGALMLAWVGARRFGAPLPPESAVPPGKRFLIDNTADLLRSGGHAHHALTRYLATNVQDVARATHVPPGLGEEATREWLDRARAGRKVSTDLATIEEDVRTSKSRGLRGILESASRVHAWRKEMTDGSRHDS